MICSIWIEATLTHTKTMTTSPLHRLCKIMRSIRSTKSLSALSRITTIILRLLKKISSAEQLQLMLMPSVRVKEDPNGTRMDVLKTIRTMQPRRESSQMTPRAPTKSAGIPMPRQSVNPKKSIKAKTEQTKRMICQVEWPSLGERTRASSPQ